MASSAADIVVGSRMGSASFVAAIAVAGHTDSAKSAAAEAAVLVAAVGCMGSLAALLFAAAEIGVADHMDSIVVPVVVLAG